MSDPLKKLTRGQLLTDLIRHGEGPFNADWFNLTVDAIKDYLKNRRTLSPGDPADDELDTETFIANVSWLDLDQYAVTGIGTWANAPGDDEATLQNFLGETNLYSADPAPGSPFAITLEPIPLGQRFVCFTGNTGDRPPSANWQAVLGVKTAWNSTQAYVPGMVVLSGGNLYFCILAHTNHVPPNATYWQLLNDRGPYLDGMTVVTGDLVVIPFLGRAVLTGVAKCQILVSDAAHQYAAPLTGTYEYLASQAAFGPAYIVQKQSGTGQKWALVTLGGNPNDVTFSAGVAVVTLENDFDVTDDGLGFCHDVPGLSVDLEDGQTYYFELRGSCFNGIGIPTLGFGGTATLASNGDTLVWGSFSSRGAAFVDDDIALALSGGGDAPSNQVTAVSGFNLVGSQAYDHAANYDVGAVVTSGGNIYVCILATTGNDPPNVTFWAAGIGSTLSFSEQLFFVWGTITATSSGTFTVQLGCTKDSSFPTDPATMFAKATLRVYKTPLGFGTFAVGEGGTGLSTLTPHGVMLGEGTNDVSFATTGTAGRALLDQGPSADPVFMAFSGVITLSAAGVTAFTATTGTGSVVLSASPALTGTPTAPTATPGTNTTQVATTAFVAAAVNAAIAGLLNFKGMTDCSANPNYPAAVKGDSYMVSVAGKIGGASGTAVDVGDWYVALANNAGGAEASVGTSWGHMEHNLVGALLASNNLSDLGNAATARTNLGLGTLATQSGTFSGTSSGTNTGDQTITLTSEVTGSGTGSFNTTIARGTTFVWTGPHTFANAVTIFGAGDGTTTTTAVTMRGANGAGTNIAGAPLNVQSGLSTGSQTPAVINFKVGAVGGSGTTLQTAFTALSLDGKGRFVVGNALGNIIIGNTGAGSTGVAITTAAGNILVGGSAGKLITTGGNNVIIGASAGQTLTTGTFNFIMGPSADVFNAADNSATILGYQAHGADSTVAIGFRAFAVEPYSIVVGTGYVDAGGTDSVSIGGGYIYGPYSVCVGPNAEAFGGFTNEIDVENSAIVGNGIWLDLFGGCFFTGVGTYRTLGVGAQSGTFTALSAVPGEMRHSYNGDFARFSMSCRTTDGGNEAQPGCLDFYLNTSLDANWTGAISCSVFDFNMNPGIVWTAQSAGAGDARMGIGGNVDANALLNINGDTKGRHFGGNGSTPGIAAGAGAGTSPTISNSGTDTHGTITVTTGTTPTLSAVIATLTFATAFNGTPRVILTPDTASAAALSGSAKVKTTDSTGGFTLDAGTTALAAATTYVWKYHTLGN